MNPHLERRLTGELTDTFFPLALMIRVMMRDGQAEPASAPVHAGAFPAHLANPAND